MQKIKKGGLWIVLAILILPNAFAYTIPYFNTNDVFTFYLENYLFIDFILAWMLFGSIARIFVEKKFGSSTTAGATPGTHSENPSIKPLYLSIGLILSLGIVGLEMQYPGYSFLNSGIISFILLFALIGTAVNDLIRGEDKKISWARILIGFALLILFLGLAFPEITSSNFLYNFGSVGSFFGENWMNILFVIFGLIALWLFFKWIWSGTKERFNRWRSGRGERETPHPLEEPDEETEPGRRRRDELLSEEEPDEEKIPPGGPTPRDILAQLARVRNRIEAFNLDVSRISRRGYIINSAESSRLLRIFQEARNEIKILLRMPNYRLIERIDRDNFFNLLREFANNINISRGFRTR